MKNLISTLGILFCVALFWVACGDNVSSCESAGGVVCNNCATSGCDISCEDGEIEACVGLAYFGGENPEDLRCAFCE